MISIEAIFISDIYI